ncbi:hypothetical protein ABZZ46_36000 [Streptomyces rochei]
MSGTGIEALSFFGPAADQAVAGDAAERAAAGVAAAYVDVR